MNIKLPCTYRVRSRFKMHMPYRVQYTSGLR